MYCTITVGLLLSNVSVASLPCNSFDQSLWSRNEIKLLLSRNGKFNSPV